MVSFDSFWKNSVASWTLPLKSEIPSKSFLWAGALKASASAAKRIISNRKIKSYEDIVSTYGKPDAEEDNGYYLQMDYQHDYSQHMTLYVYNDGLGLLGAELRGH